MDIKPLGRRVLVSEVEEPEEEEEVTEGGIVLPDSAKSEDNYIRAEVLAIGTDENIEVEVGDEVILSSFSGTEIEVDNQEMKVIKNKDILAKIE
ncbi:MAG: co-chaperone GroES [Candidatus Bipolaricaulota bacterium]|nr:co-chaperone GroES [Candidatus Bipolaricaulota bacterium]MBS3792463.1 co-chaperone GroES [Candidatus Bipolaricaulota bacterium]